MAVWNTKKNLRGSNIFVNEDFPWEIQERRKILRPVMTKARQNKRDAFIIVDRLILDGKTYTVDNIHSVPAALNPNSTATPQIGDNIKAFFGGQLPLSNFHPGKLKVGMEWYENSEQFYQKKSLC